MLGSNIEIFNRDRKPADISEKRKGKRMTTLRETRIHKNSSDKSMRSSKVVESLPDITSLYEGIKIKSSEDLSDEFHQRVNNIIGTKEKFDEKEKKYYECLYIKESGVRDITLENLEAVIDSLEELEVYYEEIRDNMISLNKNLNRDSRQSNYKRAQEIVLEKEFIDNFLTEDVRDKIAKTKEMLKYFNYKKKDLDTNIAA